MLGVTCPALPPPVNTIFFIIRPLKMLSVILCQNCRQKTPKSSKKLHEGCRLEQIPEGTASDHLFQSESQLVRAGGGLGAAADALQLGDGLLGLHSLHQRADALQIAVAASCEFYGVNDSVLQGDIDFS